LDYVKLGPFTIKEKISNLTYKLDLSAKMKIYSVQYIAMLEPVHRDVEFLLYEMEMYKGQEEDEWDIQKIVNYEEMDE